MLWHKAWLETRWRFLIGLGILVVMACGSVFEYPAVARLLAATGAIDGGPSLVGRAVTEAVALQRTYRGYLFSQWFGQNLVQTWTLFAVLLGSGGLLAQNAGSTVFTLSLPVSRTRLLSVRAATALGELAVLSFVPSLLIPLLSPAIGQSYSVADSLIHGLCLFVGGAMFFGLALVLSTLFADLWRPLLIACGVAIVISLTEQAMRREVSTGVFHVMSGETYFRSGAVPWLGLLVSVVVSVALFYAARFNVTNEDF